MPPLSDGNALEVDAAVAAHNSIGVVATEFTIELRAHFYFD